MRPRLYFILPFLLQATLWRIVMRSFFNYFAHFEVYGLENLKDLQGPVIFAPNHASEVDSVLLPLALPFWSRFSPMFYVLKEFSYFNNSSFGLRRFLYKGWLFKSLGAYPIQPDKKNYAISLAPHMQILKDGGSVCIFPEGGVTKTGEIGSAHGGVGYLAYTTELPVIPVHISGTYKLNVRGFLFSGTPINVTFGKPLVASKNDLHTQDPSVLEYHTFADRIMSSIVGNTTPKV